MTKTVSALVSVYLGCVIAAPALHASTAQESEVPRVTFTMSSANASPPYYSVTVGSIGNTTYRSMPNSDQLTGEPYTVEFTASRTTRAEAFRIAQELNFFRGGFKISQSPQAGSSTISLTFATEHTKNQIFYTSSKNPLIKRLTMLFERISTTMEFGRRLDQLRIGNQNGLLTELKHMQREAKHRQLVEFEVIAPEVQSLASDAKAPNDSRRYAQLIPEETHFLQNKSLPQAKTSREQEPDASVCECPKE